MVYHKIIALILDKRTTLKYSKKIWISTRIPAGVTKLSEYSTIIVTFALQLVVSELRGILINTQMLQLFCCFSLDRNIGRWLCIKQAPHVLHILLLFSSRNSFIHHFTNFPEPTVQTTDILCVYEGNDNVICLVCYVSNLICHQVSLYPF